MYEWILQAVVSKTYTDRPSKRKEYLEEYVFFSYIYRVAVYVSLSFHSKYRTETLI
jgi:hypothetical protein